MFYCGIELPEPAEGEIAMEAVVLVKVMTKEGKITYREWASAALHPIEALGMASTFQDTLRATIMAGARGTPPA